MTSAAQEFKEDGLIKEFVDNDGRHYYVIQFGDDSGLVFRKVRSEDDRSVSDFVLRDEPVKQSIRNIAAANGLDISQGNTQHMLRSLLRGE